MKEPKVHVGILFEPQIEFILLNPYRINDMEISGKQVVTYNEGRILWNGRLYDELLFEPVNETTDAFELLDVTIGINFHWERKEDQRFLGSLKIIVENKKLTGIKLMEGFGQTETTLTVATFPWMEPKPGSMGVPNPQYDVDLIDHDGRSVEAGEQGQIVIRTNRGKPLGLFKEYYRDAARTHEAWNNGIYYTGDVAWKDEDGYLWFVGRADDVIKSSGYRIGPFEVESALMTHPAVVECAITGVPDEIRGQVVKATIVLSKEYKAQAGESLIKELQNHVKKVTAPYKYPRVIEFVDELPKTISGKIRRVEIRKNDEK